MEQQWYLLPQTRKGVAVDLYVRNLYLDKIRGFYNADDIIKVITGVRRSGKSSIMELAAQEIRAAGTPPEHIIFLDLEKRPLRKIRTADALEALIEEHAPSSPGMTYLFIDEVQNVTGFEDVLNGFRDEGGWSIFITGSNSYLLSGEIMTKLTGRYLEFEVMPLSFDEYEGMKAFYGKVINANPLVELDTYLREGGFPRAVLLDGEADKRAYVKGVVEEIFEKDIRRRVKIRDRAAFETVRQFVINNYGAPASLNSIHAALVGGGMRISKASVSRYIGALVDAKILYECPRFDMKSKKAIRGEKKYYLADLGFYMATNVDNRLNYGPSLENIVFTYAKAHGYEASVGRIGKLECDFILRAPDGDYAYVQVAYTISQSKATEDREYRPLETIKDNYPRYVITTDYLLQRRNGIEHANLMDFMMAGREF